MAEVKPCPFCGSVATIHCDIPRLHGYNYGVGCSNPNCTAYSGYGMMVCETKEEAVGAWNRRSEEQGEVDAMSGMEEEMGNLVREMKRHICRLHRDEPCAVLCDAYDDMLHVCAYKVRMRELGIEATDD